LLLAVATELDLSHLSDGQVALQVGTCRASTCTHRRPASSIARLRVEGAALGMPVGHLGAILPVGADASALIKQRRLAAVPAKFRLKPPPLVHLSGVRGHSGPRKSPTCGRPHTECTPLRPPAFKSPLRYQARRRAALRGRRGITESADPARSSGGSCPCGRGMQRGKAVCGTYSTRPCWDFRDTAGTQTDPIGVSEVRASHLN
jgi:hypothetical protein